MGHSPNCLSDGNPQGDLKTERQGVSGGWLILFLADAGQLYITPVVVTGAGTGSQMSHLPSEYPN